MHPKRLITLATLAAGLVLGVVVGPLVRESTASAQTQPTAQTKPAADSTLRNLFLDKLAATLNIQRSALDSAITAAGVSTADAAAQQGTLTQAQADALKARIQAGDLGALWAGRGPSGPRGPAAGQPQVEVHQVMVDAAAKSLGLTAEELRAELRGVKTIAQLAQEKGTTEQAVIDAALAAAEGQLDQAVADGKLTQAQADTIYAQLKERGLQFGGRGPGGRRGQDAPRVAPTATPAATS
jgi:hypothetical protein